MIGNYVIFAVGLLIYGSYGIGGLLWLLGATAVSYGAALLIPKRKWLLWPAVAAVTGLLLLLRLQGLLGLNLPSIMGASYFSLQIIAYLADVYRGKYPPEKNFFRYAFHITYLPHLFVGPIEPFSTMSAAMDSRRITLSGVYSGVTRILWGLGKKLIIAARAGVIISAISADTAAYRGAYALAAMVLYSLQLYADFSGGMDVVLGVSQVLGLKLSENFNVPFLAETFQEFWRRWHITLGGFLRSYVYIPLGGNRKGKLRKSVNLLITFLVSGIWHGLEYLLWGLINGIFVAFGDQFKTKWKHLNRFLTFFLVSLLWAFFVWPNTATALSMVASIVTTFNYGSFFGSILELGLTAGDWIVLILSAAMLWIYDVRGNAVPAALGKRSWAVRTAVICLLALVVLVFGMYGIGFDQQAFIYSKF
jgi:hypothetical protein